MRKLFLLLSALFMVRCATLSQPMMRIRVGSKPPGASVELAECGAGSTKRAVTPATVFVMRTATRCSMTFTLPQQGSRTVFLSRQRDITWEEDDVSFHNICEFLEDPGCYNLGRLLLSGAIWSLGKGLDPLMGTRYKQSRSRILVDFSKPVPTVSGRFTLVAVNGAELPATALTTREDCQIQMVSGSLLLEESSHWSSELTVQPVCGRETGAAATTTAEGVFIVDGERIRLRSQRGEDSGVVDGDRLDLSLQVTGTSERQVIVYTFRRE